MVPGGGDREYVQGDGNKRLPSAQDLDVTVLAFAQWLSEMKGRSNASLQQMLAEMGIIRNGITSNNTDLTEFKRNTATVQQQMQSQISDLRDKLTEAYTEIANMKKTKSQFEQEVHAESQSLSEQLQFKTLELETLKKAYAQTHQQLQQQIIQLQTEVNELRMRGDDASRQNHMTSEHNVSKLSEVEMASHYTSNEMKRLRGDHDQAISNLAENMNRWNETLRDLSKEFHDFQKVMNVNQQRLQNNIWEAQGKTGLQATSDSAGRLEAAVSSPSRQAAGHAAPVAVPHGHQPQAAAGVRSQSPVAQTLARPSTHQPQPGMLSPYASAPPPSHAPYQMCR